MGVFPIPKEVNAHILCNFFFIKLFFESLNPIFKKYKIKGHAFQRGKNFSPTDHFLQI